MYLVRKTPPEGKNLRLDLWRLTVQAWFTLVRWEQAMHQLHSSCEVGELSFRILLSNGVLEN